MFHISGVLSGVPRQLGGADNATPLSAWAAPRLYQYLLEAFGLGDASTRIVSQAELGPVGS